MQRLELRKRDLMKPHAIIAHAIIYTLLSTLLAVSITTNYLFYTGLLHIDGAEAHRREIISQIFDDQHPVEAPTKKGAK